MLLWIIIVPAVWNIYLSFTNYRGIKPPQFAGLTNWVRLMKDTTFWVSFCNSIWMIIAMVVVPILLGLILSSLVFDVVQKKFGPKWLLPCELSTISRSCSQSLSPPWSWDGFSVRRMVR